LAKILKKSSSQVQDIETTLHKLPPDSYHGYKVGFNPQEYAATFALYADLDKIEGSRKTELLDSCRRRAWFVRHNETGRVRVVANACRLRWCPLCADAHKNLITHNVADWLKKADHPKFLTLTLKHTSAPLAHQIDSLYNSFIKFRRLKEIKKDLAGGVWFFQIKKSDNDGLWHPHLHCLVAGKFIPHALLSRLWLRTTLSSNVVDIRGVRDNDSAAKEVARYCARPATLAELDQFDALELVNALHGRRICGTWGCGKKIQLNMIAEPDKLNWSNIGSWSLIINLMKTNNIAQEIYNAWKEKRSLAQAMSLSEADEFIDGYKKFMINAIKTPEPDKQFWLD
jgi:hypothetical protein